MHHYHDHIKKTLPLWIRFNQSDHLEVPSNTSVSSLFQMLTPFHIISYAKTIISQYKTLFEETFFEALLLGDFRGIYLS